MSETGWRRKCAATWRERASATASGGSDGAERGCTVTSDRSLTTGSRTDRALQSLHDEAAHKPWRRNDAGARSAVNPHAACDAAGTGNGITGTPTRARRGNHRKTQGTASRLAGKV